VSFPETHEAQEEYVETSCAWVFRITTHEISNRLKERRSAKGIDRLASDVGLKNRGARTKLELFTKLDFHISNTDFVYVRASLASPKESSTASSTVRASEPGGREEITGSARSERKEGVSLCIGSGRARGRCE
jgi:hypothetical protein